MDIVSGIAAASQALGIAKALRGIEKSYDEAAWKAQLADLVSALADTKLALTEAKQTLAEKDKEIERLRANFAAQGELVKGDGDYKYFAGNNGKPLGYPVCPKCEITGTIVQLKQNGGAIQARCPSCLTEYQPVTCFLPPEDPDGTLHARANRLTSEAWRRANEKLARLNGY